MENPFATPNHDKDISLLSTSVLPDRLRSLFSFRYFNAMQTKAFHPLYESDENVVLSAPTGSGKTACFELAIARLLRNESSARGVKAFPF